MAQLKERMKAAALDTFGGPEKIKLQDIPIPEIAKNEVLIKVESAGIGPWDAEEREGYFEQYTNQKAKFPYVLGSDGAGIIEKVGADVTEFKKGDRVFAVALVNPKGGFYAEYTAVDHTTVAKIPEYLSTEQAGALASDALTAICGLDNTLKLKRGENIIIFGASGGIGHIAIQFAKKIGANVLAIASGNDGVKLAEKLGADLALDGKSDDIAEAIDNFLPNGADCFFLTAGGPVAEKLLSCLSPEGRACHPNGLRKPIENKSGVDLKTFDVEVNNSTMKRLEKLIAQKPFEVHIDASYSLNQAAKAQEDVVKHHLGKLIVHPN